MLPTRQPIRDPHRPARWRLRVRPRRRGRRRRLPARLLAGLATVVLTTGPTAPAQGRQRQAPSLRAAPALLPQAPPPRPRPLPPPGTPVERWHQPPVDAPVVDGFRPPSSPFGPGNRGIEYDTEPGTVVRASAGGWVAFAGLVARHRHVTVAHPGGLRTSYSFLARVDVAIGQRVAQGDRLGLAGERLHFGARRGGVYVDPATLFGERDVEVELLPFEVPPGDRAAPLPGRARTRRSRVG